MNPGLSWTSGSKSNTPFWANWTCATYRWSLNFCLCITWFLDFNDLVGINKAWPRKEPKVSVLQANAQLVQKRECWILFLSSLGVTFCYWIFLFSCSKASESSICIITNVVCLWKPQLLVRLVIILATSFKSRSKLVPQDKLNCTGRCLLFIFLFHRINKVFDRMLCLWRRWCPPPLNTRIEFNLTHHKMKRLNLWMKSLIFFTTADYKAVISLERGTILNAHKCLIFLLHVWK